MKKVSLLLVCVLSLCITSLAIADTNEESVSTLLKVTGITDQTSSIPSVIQALLGQQGAFFGSDQQTKIFKIVMNNFSEVNFNKSISKEVLRDFREEYYKKIMQTYSDELFINITKSEVYSSSSDALSTMKTFDYSKITESRLSIIENFLRTSEIRKNQELVTLSSIEAFFSIFNLFLPEDKKLSDSVLQAVLKQTSDRLNSEEQIESMKNQYAFTYREFTDKELVAYFNYYHSEEMSWLMKRFQIGFLEGYKSSMTNTALQIISEFNIQQNNKI